MDQQFENTLHVHASQYFEVYRKLETEGVEVNPALYDQVMELEEKILHSFGLPVSERYLQILWDFAEADVTKMGNKEFGELKSNLAKAAEAYLLAPVLSDEQFLLYAAQDKKNAFDVLPDLKIPTHDYPIFVYNEILLKNIATPTEVLKELRMVDTTDSYHEIFIVANSKEYRKNELYERVQKIGLRFFEEYVRWSQHTDAKKQEEDSDDTEFINSEEDWVDEEDYTPNYFTLTGLRVTDIVLDKDDTPVVICYILNEQDNEKQIYHIAMVDYSDINHLLLHGGDLGKKITNFLMDTISDANFESPKEINLMQAFQEELALDGIYLEVYYPFEKDEEGNWVENTDDFVFLNQIFTRNEMEFLQKADDIKEKLEECFQMVSVSFVYYQKLKRFGVNELEARRKAGLDDELLFNIASLLNKLGSLGADTEIDTSNE